MSADEHPEDLIDRARRGGLAPEEQAILERHLAGCSACAGQLALAPRFARELAPHPRDELLYQRAVEGALQRLRHSPRIARVPRSPPWSRWAAAAALLLVGVTGAAAVIRHRMAAISRPAIPPAPPAVEARAPVAPRRPVESPPAEGPVPLDSPPPKSAAAARGSARPAVITASAEALFERGEQLRRARRADAAIAVYRRLQATYPESGEARLSFALAGELLLERGRPGDALAQFDRHLGLDGEAAEEALAGRATALEQLHRTSEATAAWRSLLARFPRSVYAERARARLDQMNERR